VLASVIPEPAFTVPYKLPVSDNAIVCSVDISQPQTMESQHRDCGCPQPIYMLPAHQVLDLNRWHQPMTALSSSLLPYSSPYRHISLLWPLMW